MVIFRIIVGGLLGWMVGSYVKSLNLDQAPSFLMVVALMFIIVVVCPWLFGAKRSGSK